MDPRAKLHESLELQESGFTGIGGQACPFYERLTGELLRDVDRGGPVWDWLEPYATETFDKAYVLRLLGTLHRMALAGDDADLVAHFPSTGGDGDAAATYRVIEGLLADPPLTMVDMIGRRRRRRTRWAGRIALASGLLVIADALRMPIVLREIGWSAGLNLRLDAFLVFSITKVGTIAGCMVLDGKLERNSLARVVRKGKVVSEGVHRLPEALQRRCQRGAVGV